MVLRILICLLKTTLLLQIFFARAFALSFMKTRDEKSVCKVLDREAPLELVQSSLKYVVYYG
jgi:hypothetical protein